MNAYTKQDLSVMQAWPLERKIRVTQAKILEWYLHFDGRTAVSFSGGKDSTVLLDLARRVAPDIGAAFVDTGLEYPEIRQFVKTIPNVTWLRPELPFHKVLAQHGYLADTSGRDFDIVLRKRNLEAILKASIGNILLSLVRPIP